MQSHHFQLALKFFVVTSQLASLNSRYSIHSVPQKPSYLFWQSN